MLRLPVLLSAVPRLCVCRTERNDEILCYFGCSIKIWSASFIKSTRTSKGSRPLKSDGDVYSHPWDLQTQATLRAAKKNLTALGHANNFTKSLSNFYITYLNIEAIGAQQTSHNLMRITHHAGWSRICPSLSFPLTSKIDKPNKSSTK